MPKFSDDPNRIFVSSPHPLTGHETPIATNEDMRKYDLGNHHKKKETLMNATCEKTLRFKIEMRNRHVNAIREVGRSSNGIF